MMEDIKMPIIRKKHQDKTSHNEWKRLLTNDSPFAVKEAYVKLRTNMMFSLAADGEKPCQVFCITSPSESEGKSLTSANIAISFAMLGKRTLLIDADMRRPTQNKLWKLKSESGLSSILARVDSCDVFDIEGLPLSIICAGNTPPNPSELLSSANMSKLIDGLREQYDYIIIDTPPINTVADAQILSRVVDSTVMVCRSGNTKNTELHNALDLVERSNGNVCGIVLNNLNMKSSKYSYHYKYGYGKNKEYVSRYGE